MGKNLPYQKRVDVRDHRHLVLFFSYEPSMRKIEDYPIEPFKLEINVSLHVFHIDTMQHRGAHSLQLRYI
jgi:hypothetical protein